ncbi:hypothetical protein D3C87_1141440 [compost metagenome]
MGQLGQTGAVQHHAAAAAAEANAARGHREVNARDLRRCRKLRGARGVDQQGFATVQDCTGTDGDYTALRGVHILADDLDRLGIGHANQRTPVFGRRHQNIVGGVGCAFAVVDRSLLRLHDQVAAAAGARALGADEAAGVHGDLVGGGQDDLRGEQFGAGAVSHDDVSGRHVELRAQQVSLARAAHQQAAGTEIREAGGIDREVAVCLQRACVLAGTDDGDLLAGDVDQAAAPALLGLRQQRAVQRQALGGFEHDSAAVARQARGHNVLSSQAVLRELEGVR